MESEIWSAILSGCPSVTDSDVKRYGFLAGNSVSPSQALGLQMGTQGGGFSENNVHLNEQFASIKSYQRTGAGAIQFAQGVKVVSGGGNGSGEWMRLWGEWG
jgi:hypothetical protein